MRWLEARGGLFRGSCACNRHIRAAHRRALEAPAGSGTCGPRLRRPDEPVPASSSASQPLATTRDEAGADSRDSQVFAPFTEDSADRLRTLLTVNEVAVYLHVCTKTVYRLCALGELRHIRALNAIRIAPSDVDALVFAHRI